MLCHPSQDVSVQKHVNHFGNMMSANQIQDGSSIESMHERGTSDTNTEKKRMKRENWRVTTDERLEI